MKFRFNGQNILVLHREQKVVKPNKKYSLETNNNCETWQAFVQYYDKTRPTRV